MKNFSDNEIKEILGEETAEKEEKNHKILAAVGIGAVLVAVILAIVIPLSTIKNDEAPDMGGNKHEITPVTDFEYSISEGYATINKYIGNGEVIVIPEEIENAPVKHIGNEAFNGSENIKEVIMPDCITSIGNSSFGNMTALTKVRLSEALESIGSECFKGCVVLTEITIPENVTSVGEYAFSECKALETVVINGPVKEIPDYCFLDCSKLIKVTLPEGTEAIGKQAFRDTDIGGISLPTTLKKINDKAFSGSLLTDIVIPDSVSYIGEEAFSKSKNLTSVILPSSLETLGVKAFAECSSLSGIAIPDSLKTIPDSCFYQCSALQSLSLGESTEFIDNSAFTQCSKLSSISFNSALKTIDYSAFSYCTGLTSLTLPDSLETVGSFAFSTCNKLNNVTFGDNVTYIGDNAFNCCYELRTITLPKKLETLGKSAFRLCISLNKLDMPDNVTHIEELTFADCKSLTILKLPAGLETMDVEKTFQNCESLYELIFPEGFRHFIFNRDVDTSQGFGGYEFALGCSGLKSVHFPSTFEDAQFASLFYSPSFDPPTISFTIDEKNKNFITENGNIYNSDKTMLCYAHPSNIIENNGNYFYKVDDSVTSAAVHAFLHLGIQYSETDNTFQNIYILFRNLTGDYDKIYELTNNTMHLICRDSFIIDLFLLDENNFTDLRKNIYEALFNVREKGFNKDIYSKIELGNNFVVDETSASVYLCFKNTTENFSYYDEINAYIVKENGYISDEYYICSDKTYYSEGLGNYKIWFHRNDNPEKVKYTEFTDYFLIREKMPYNDTENVFRIAEELLAKHFPDTPKTGEYDCLAVCAISDYETLNIEGILSGMLNVYAELYPSGFYGNDGAQVYTTENGEFRYSVRLVNPVTGEIYY